MADKKENKYVIAVLSFDRVGIVSNVTGTIFELGGNIDTISQTVLDGCFTILVTAVFPEGPTADSVREAIEKAGKRLDLDVSVRPYKKPVKRKAAGQNIYFLTAVGRDRKGIFHEITGCLAGHAININDLYCFLRSPEEFVLVGELNVPDKVDLVQVQIDLEEIGSQENVSIRIQHENLFQATNDLYITRREMQRNS
ncbi:MAG: glycine cleavage system protein R [bacterium]